MLRCRTIFLFNFPYSTCSTNYSKSGKEISITFAYWKDRFIFADHYFGVPQFFQIAFFKTPVFDVDISIFEDFTFFYVFFCKAIVSDNFLRGVFFNILFSGVRYFQFFRYTFIGLLNVIFSRCLFSQTLFFQYSLFWRRLVFNRFLNDLCIGGIFFLALFFLRTHLLGFSA